MRHHRLPKQDSCNASRRSAAIMGMNARSGQARPAFTRRCHTGEQDTTLVAPLTGVIEPVRRACTAWQLAAGQKHSVGEGLNKPAQTIQ